MLSAVRAENPDQVLHMGDHDNDNDCGELQRGYPILPVKAVRGNCDLYSHDDMEALLTLEGKRFFITHGHRYQVKMMGTGLIVAAAVSAGADVAIFGHTHIPLCETSSGILVINPGSVRFTRTYGVLTLNGGRMEYTEKTI